MSIEKIAVFDIACPDVERELRFHANLNQHAQCWRNDFELAALMGFTTIRGGVPWPLVEVNEGEYQWEVLDEMFNWAEALGCRFIPVLTQFSWPLWISGGYGISEIEHPVLSPELPHYFHRYTKKVLERYGKKIQEIILLVEIGTDAKFRAMEGIWGPHVRDNLEVEKKIQENLVETFNQSSRLCGEYGVKVISHEAADALHIALRLEADEIGIDHYTRVYKELAQVLLEWKKAFELTGKQNPVFSIMERGECEWWDCVRGEFTPVREYSDCRNRLKDIGYYQCSVEVAKAAGIMIGKIAAFIVGNMWSDPTMPLNPHRECDRNGFATLCREKNGSLTRLPHSELATTFHQSFT